MAVDDSDWRKREAKEDAEVRRIQATPIEVDGFKLTIGDIFPERYEAKNFASKLELLQLGRDSTAGKTKGKLDEKAVLEDEMFGGGDSE